MKSLKDLVELLKVIDLDYPMLLNYEDKVWYIEDSYVSWNDYNNLEDLYFEDGKTYRMYVPEGIHREDGYVIMNVDTETGTWQTVILDGSKEIDYQDLKEKFED